jgi:Insulin-induced protein (INSIG)
MDGAEGTNPPLFKPLPRRPFQPSSSLLSADAQPQLSPTSPDGSADPESPGNGKADVSRSRSILNLTSSTLFGIYAPTALGESETMPTTPWGTGSQTPLRSGSIDGVGGGLSRLSTERAPAYPNGAELEERLLRDRNGGGSRGRESLENKPTRPGQRPASATRPSVGRVLLRVSVLFSFGAAYGALVAHLHDNRQIAPIKVPVTVSSLDGASLSYLAIWGLVGIGMGSLFPWVDGLTRSRKASALHAVEWNDVVRSIGAFVGIAFAIVRPPWLSSLSMK